MNLQNPFASFTVTVEAKVLAEAPRNVGDPLNTCTLDEFVREGRARYVGVSNYDAQQTAVMLRGEFAIGGPAPEGMPRRETS